MLLGTPLKNNKQSFKTKTGFNKKNGKINPELQRGQNNNAQLDQNKSSGTHSKVQRLPRAVRKSVLQPQDGTETGLQLTVGESEDEFTDDEPNNDTHNHTSDFDSDSDGEEAGSDRSGSVGTENTLRKSLFSRACAEYCASQGGCSTQGSYEQTW